MANYLWKEEIDNYYAFWYTIKLDVTNEDFQSKILDFDYWFLLNGFKYGLFLFKNDHLIDEYFTRRKVCFFNRGRGWLSLLDFEQFKDTSLENMFILLPDNNGEMQSYPQGYSSYLYLHSDPSNFHLTELNAHEAWRMELNVSISSSSTIWTEQIIYGIDNNDKPINFEPPVDNRFYAYRITPRFNSFLRELKTKIQELGGTITLDDEHHEDVTINGVLLDGRIVYQEDIDEGRILLPKVGN